MRLSYLTVSALVRKYNLFALSFSCTVPVTVPAPPDAVHLSQTRVLPGVVWILFANIEQVFWLGS